MVTPGATMRGLVLTFVFVKLAISQNLIPEVIVEQGRIRGSWQTSWSNRTFAAFRGIPYAQPPIGKHRFKEAVVAKAWPGVWNASTLGSPCLQYTGNSFESGPSVIGDENCLFINVFTPQLPSPGTPAPFLDVLVYIHGGAFMRGSSNNQGPEYLMDKDVVIVTFNYRIGILGFLSTEDDVVPGNNGLKDQVLALQWIQKNIAAFGGNPASVTLTGSSAGGASVHLHYLSPLSKGLFHKGMSLSGTSLQPWSIIEAPRVSTLKLASLMGCDTHTSKILVDCLRSRPAGSIVQQTQNFYVWKHLPICPFGPTIEKAGTKPFISKQPVDLLLEGRCNDIPWLTSIVTEEGTYPAAEYLSQKDLLTRLQQHFVELSPYILDYNNTAPKEKHREIALLALKEYMDNQPIAEETYDNFIQMVGDRLFVSDAVRAAQLQAEFNKSPVFFYVFSHKGTHSLYDLMTKKKIDLGVGHGDDIAYVFEKKSLNLSIDETEEDRNMMKLMVDIYTSFAKTGNPTPAVLNGTWPPVTPHNTELDFLLLGNGPTISVEASTILGNRKFWDSVGILDPQIISESRRRLTDEL